MHFVQGYVFVIMTLLHYEQGVCWDFDSGQKYIKT